MSAFLELSRAWGETYRSECKYDAQFTACSIDSTNTGIFLRAVWHMSVNVSCTGKTPHELTCNRDSSKP